MLLLDILIVEITLPVKGLLLVGDIFGRATGSKIRDCIFRFRSEGEIDDFWFLGGWLWNGNRLTTKSKGCLALRGPWRVKKFPLTTYTSGVVPSRSTSRVFELEGIRKEY